ncbi:outer membrane protein TOM13-domain-containing protein [Dendryphion nanum]|uniref:Outer membrane protein TOM13-domain-containing protein n=1 Tax=Dendryphion nanum TaxID=256645 RepID=A0A9P9ED71_9PLEO|nr:outer membrane protein TOM13-domain-containing protein [Dendryphion nanum]
MTDLSNSGLTIPSDSEIYSAPESPPSPSHSPESSSSSSPLILYKPPTIWGLLRGAAINLVLPFVNGLMLGFGELIANEVAFRWGWGGTKIFPSHRSSHRVGPGVEMRPDPVERRRRDGRELDMYTALE